MGPKKFLFLTIPILLISISSSLSSSTDIISSSSSSLDNKGNNNNSNGYISFSISEKGLEFAKDFLIQNAISALIPLKLPQIEKKVKILLVGTVDMVVSNIVIYNINVSYSVVKSGDLGVTIVAFDATADLSFDWSYSYSNWFFEITDNGVASVQVKGMDIGMTLGLSSQQGTLRVSPVDCGCYVNYISIILDGGASWLYQGFVDFFEEDIANAVEDTITNNVKDAVIKLDSVLQSLPKEVSVGDIATINVTITDGPILSNTSLLIGIDGLFSQIDSEVSSHNYEKSLLSSNSCNSQENMVAISVHEIVLNSASSAYFSTNKMYWVIDELPDKKIYKKMLNTAGWRFIIPKLYKEFPNDAMSLNFTVVSPPTIRVENNEIAAAINSDVIINVMDAGEVIPVACISMEIEASGFAGISLSTIAGGVSLSKFSLSLKWSEIGTLHMLLVQSMMSTLLKRIIVPIVNLRLRVGYSIPAFSAHGEAPVTNQFVGSIIKACAFQLPFQPPESQAFFATSLAQGAVNPSPLTHHPTSGGTLVHAVHNTSDSELLLKRPRSFGVLEEIGDLPTSLVARGSQSNFYSFLPPDDLPKNVILSLNQGSEVKTMDFHPEHQTLLLVGTNTGDIAIWEIGSRLRVAHKGFSIWNTRKLSMAFQASLTNEYPVLVNRVMWSPDGLLFGAAYSKSIVHIYSYRGSHDLRDHLEIEAHVGNVNDLAFIVQDRKFTLITCGEDKTIKVWDAITGANHLTFEGHDAPVYSVCLHHKANIQACDIFFFSTSIDGKIKAWTFDKPGPVLQIDSPGYACIRMKYNADGLRIFTCGSNKNWESYILEWNEDEGIVKQKYLGLANQYAGVVQFDTTKRFLAAGDEFSIKFWDMDNDQLLFSTIADGGLPALPCVQFNKSGTLLAVSTSDYGFKILGNAEGLRLVRNIENQMDANRVASATVSKASTITTCSISSFAAGESNGFPDRNISLPVMAALNQDSQDLSNVMFRDTDELEFSIIWRSKEVTEPSQLRCMKLPDNLLPAQITRLMYAASGSAILALDYNAAHKLWKWKKTEKNITGNATANVAPQLWQPSSGILMTNDIVDVNVEDTIPCLAISKNSSYVLSASGGKVSLFNLVTFRTLTTFMDSPPAATCLVFHPQDNNIVAVGMSDASINIYNVRIDQVLKKLTGHLKSVTGLAFSADSKILISAGADAQLCLWNTESGERLGSKFLKLPSRRTINSQAETRVQFSMDQSRFLVVHETQVAIYNLVKLDCVMQWVPRPSSGTIIDAVYSCDGKSIFVSIEDGNVNILTTNRLRLKCRINYAAYMPSPSNISDTRVCPSAIAAHPSDPNQFALGLSDGGVYVLEPLESDKEWGSDPYLEKREGPSTSTKAAAAGSD